MIAMRDPHSYHEPQGHVRPRGSLTSYLVTDNARMA